MYLIQQKCIWSNVFDPIDTRVIGLRLTVIRKIPLFEGLENFCWTVCLVLGKMCIRHSFKVKKCESSEKADLFPSCISSCFNSHFKFLLLVLFDVHGNINSENNSFLYRFVVSIIDVWSGKTPGVQKVPLASSMNILVVSTEDKWEKKVATSTCCSQKPDGQMSQPLFVVDS